MKLPRVRGVVNCISRTLVATMISVDRAPHSLALLVATFFAHPTVVLPTTRITKSELNVAQSCDTIASTRIRRLCTDASSDSHAEEAFWRELDGRAPLQELIPPRNVGDELVTFVWRGDDSTASVELDAPLPPPRNARFADGPRPLARLAGTGVWYRTERLPLDFRLSYSFRVTRGAGTGVASRRVSERDPLNHGLALMDASVAAGLVAPPQPWLTRLPGIAQGQLRHDSLFSHALGQERTFTIYQPARSTGPGAAALVIILDGERYGSELPVPAELDNLIGKGMMQSATVVFVDTRRWNRQEDLACNRSFAAFVARELVANLQKERRVRVPARMTVIAGSSQGGLQSACTAFWYPSVFGNVLSISGSFFWYPGWPAHEVALSDQTGWFTSLVAQSPRKALRWFVASGTFEGDGVPENRRMRDVLIAKGYDPVYSEFSGGHDEAQWQGAIADGLVALLPSASVRKAGRR